MDALTAVQLEQKPRASAPLALLDWTENPAVQKLLDVVVAVLAEEFIRTAKENPEVFRTSTTTEKVSVYQLNPGL